MAETPHPLIRSVGRALPPHYVDQETLSAALAALWAGESFNSHRLAKIHKSVLVGGRHLALPIAEYAGLDGLGSRSDAFLRVGLELGEAALGAALARAGLVPAELDHLYLVSTTGLAVPSLDARLANRMGMKPSLRRTPIFGLGCLAGAAGMARAADLLRGFPNDVAALLSVELCSLTLQQKDHSASNVVATGLFGDGAAAVILEGGARPVRAPGPRVLATRSVLYPGTERVMGWDVVDSGFKIVLSAKVPELVAANIGRDVDAFLDDWKLDRADIRHWVAHTGGPKVLEAIGMALGLAPDRLDRSWRSLREVGNLSSASVLFVLGDLLESDEAQPGDLGLLAAMGPGFSCELLLLRW